MTETIFVIATYALQNMCPSLTLCRDKILEIRANTRKFEEIHNIGKEFEKSSPARHCISLETMIETYKFRALK